jgi:hypothetical protein
MFSGMVLLQDLTNFRAIFKVDKLECCFTAIDGSRPLILIWPCSPKVNRFKSYAD